MKFIYILLCMALLTGPSGLSGAEHPFCLTTKKKATICLNMIVKNESHVITRCLDSVLPLIDYWVICDTGSTDGTQKIIIDYMKEKGIPGELHENAWVNFGHNREEALRLARFKADYLLFIDADDVLHFDDNFILPPLIHDCYLFRSIADSTEYLWTRLIKTSVDWHWNGVLHEYVFTESARSSAILPGVQYIYICDGARAKDPNKHLKDASILHAALEKEPDNSRYMFYLGQTYASGHDLENAIKYYTKRVEMGGWDQETFWSMVQIAHLKQARGDDAKSVEEWFVKALKYRPTRPEPYAYLMSEARQKGDFQKGYELGQVAIKLPPSKDILYIQTRAYDLIKIEFAICAWWLGHYEECLAVANELLKKKDLAPELRPHVEETIRMANQKLNEKSLDKALDEIFG